VLLQSVWIAAAPAATLVGFAELPADTFLPGPTSGQGIKAVNGRNPPFINQQPVQGFSALIKAGSNSYFALSDNGFGTRVNSFDYLLSIYRVVPDFRTAKGGSGTIKITDIIHLSDPDAHLPYQAKRKADHLLTGADLDPESLRRADDGSFWIGEEFNPALVHFNTDGEMLAPPYKLAGLNAVDNPMGQASNLPRSRGFEGMAQSPDGKWLYPMLEGPVDGFGPGLNIYTFNTQELLFVNKNAGTASFRYQLDQGATAIGDFTMFSETAGLILERDSSEGNKALIKRVFQIDFNKIDEEGFLAKTLVADLLDIHDPHDLNRDGAEIFTFPFWTIEGIVVLDAKTLGVVNDNNYPLGQARDDTATRPDNTEFILIEVGALWD